MTRSTPGAEAATSVLLTDLYQLTMLQAHFDQGMAGEAVFEAAFRRLPERRNFLLAGGLEQALDFLAGLRFLPDEIDWLAGTGRFTPAFLDHLAELRFTGDVDAAPEGTVVFPDEPVLRVVAPLPEAQLVESRLLNLLHFQTLVASKAARCVLAAPGRLLVDFGMRRAHGAEAAVLAARAAWLAGMGGTATVLAGRRFDIPLFGTMAHSFILTHEMEEVAFAAFARSQPGNVTLLVDTYDTEAAVAKLVALAPELAAAGVAVQGVRLDSGDLIAHARAVRRILDDGGRRGVRIFASGDLDEDALAKMVAEDAPVDGFGVGTRLDTSADAPYLECAYKLVEYAGRPVRKRSEGKASWPGRKQVWRRHAANGTMTGDVVGLEGEAPEGEPLLVPVMRRGERLPGFGLAEARERAAVQLARLPSALRALGPAAQPYPVEISAALRELAATADAARGRSQAVNRR
jgi:nicotinate phosphoribosyltransferase